MKKYKLSDRWYLVILACLLLLSTGKAQNHANTDTAQHEFPTAQTLTTHVRQLISQDNYVALETLANRLRTSKERFADGDWKLYVFYQAVSWPLQGERSTDLDWEPHLLKLQQWYKGNTQSITANVAYAGALVEFARQARVQGQEWSDLGSEAGGKVFQARLKGAIKHLLATKKLKERCPHLYVVMLRVAQTQGWSWAEFNIPYAQGIALEPTYQYFYQAKALNLLPRNHGGQGEWENYANDVYEHLGSKDGALVYYMIASHLRPYFGQNFFNQNRVNYSRLKEGYMVLVEEVKGDNFRHNEMAFFASYARDAATAKLTFDRVGTKRDRNVWQYQDWFDQKRNWANDSVGANMRAVSSKMPISGKN